MHKSFTKKMIFAAMASVVSFNALVFGFTGVVSAHGNYPKPIVDDFNKVYLKPSHKAKWWIINWGEDNLTQGRFEALTGPFSSFSIKHQGNKKFGRLSVQPQTTPGFYVNVDVAEEHSGFPAEVVNEWQPTTQKSVEIKAKVRWSEGFNTTGTGGAIGSSGVWLWNSPYDVVNYDPLALNKSFGFNYNEAGSYGGFLQGLTFNVIYDNNPIYVTPVPVTLNMQNWNEFKSVWSVDALGVESIKFYVNNALVGTTVLPAPLGKLSTEIWNDNQHVIFDQNGLSIVYENPTTTQNFDIDHFSLRMINN